MADEKRDYIISRLQHYKGKDKDTIIENLLKINTLSILISYEYYIEDKLRKQYNEEKERKEILEKECDNIKSKLSKITIENLTKDAAGVDNDGYIFTKDGYVVGVLSESMICSISDKDINIVKNKGYKIHEYYNLSKLLENKLKEIKLLSE